MLDIKLNGCITTLSLPSRKRELKQHEAEAARRLFPSLPSRKRELKREVHRSSHLSGLVASLAEA